MLNNREGIEIVSVNIEGHKRLDLVSPFFQKLRPEAILLQEIFEPDVHSIAKTLGMNCIFAPMSKRPLKYYSSGSAYSWGVAILTRGKILKSEISYYHGTSIHIPDFGQGISGPIEPAVAYCTIEHSGEKYNLATTHFPWAPDGKASDEQRLELIHLLEILGNMGEIILGIDTNAPRGGEIFNKLSSKYKDNIPPEIKTTIDGARHKAGYLELVVDGLFTAPEYEARDVKVLDGVSDHCAIFAKIYKSDL